RNLRIDGARDVVAQRVQAVLGGNELLRELCEPARMGEVARPHDGDALALRPPVEAFEVQLLARRARQVGMDVQVRHVAHLLRAYGQGLSSPSHGADAPPDPSYDCDVRRRLSLVSLVLTGCLSSTHVIPREELQRLVTVPPEQRGQHVRVIQGGPGAETPPEAPRVGVSAVPRLGRPEWVPP